MSKHFQLHRCALKNSVFRNKKCLVLFPFLATSTACLSQSVFTKPTGLVKTPALRTQDLPDYKKPGAVPTVLAISCVSCITVRHASVSSPWRDIANAT